RSYGDWSSDVCSSDLSPGEQLTAIGTRCHEMVTRQYRALLGDVLPNLDRAGVRLLSTTQLGPEADHFVADYFAREVFPVLTPIEIGRASCRARVCSSV